MRGGFTSEERITELLVKNKASFDDPRSALVRDSDLNPHLILHGTDMEKQRARIVRRDRGRCKLRLPGCTRVGEELEHEIGGGYRRCDCDHNLRMACHNCQRVKHNREIAPWTMMGDKP
jgi:hypothetical protein